MVLDMFGCVWLITSFFLQCYYNKFPVEPL